MEQVIVAKEIVTAFGSSIVHDGVSLSINKGEIYGLLGPSGCGKSTLMREMIMLEHYKSGFMSVLGYDLNRIRSKEANLLRKKWGILFQSNALFTSLTVAENIAVLLREYTALSSMLISEIVAFKIDIVGLKQSDAMLYPSQLSGGMKKKAALARALVMDPMLLFLDEPTSGLDPISAREFDELILKLKEMLDLTVVMVSHDLESITTTLDRMAVIDNRKIAAEGTLREVIAQSSPFIQTFFSTMKGRQ